MAHEKSVTIGVNTLRGKKYVNIKGAGYKNEDDAARAHMGGKNPSLDGVEYDDVDSAVKAAKKRSRSFDGGKGGKKHDHR